MRTAKIFKCIKCEKRIMKEHNLNVDMWLKMNGSPGNSPGGRCPECGNEYDLNKKDPKQKGGTIHHIPRIEIYPKEPKPIVARQDLDADMKHLLPDSRPTGDDFTPGEQGANTEELAALGEELADIKEVSKRETDTIVKPKPKKKATTKKKIASESQSS